MRVRRSSALARRVKAMRSPSAARAAIKRGGVRDIGVARAEARGKWPPTRRRARGVPKPAGTAAGTTKTILPGALSADRVRRKVSATLLFRGTGTTWHSGVGATRAARTMAAPIGEQGPRTRPASMNPIALFARLDQDKDGTLSLKEFSAGVRRLQRTWASRTQQECAPRYASFRGHGRHGRAMQAQWSPHPGSRYGNCFDSYVRRASPGVKRDSPIFADTKIGTVPHYGHHGRAMQSQWSSADRHHGHHGQLAHWNRAKAKTRFAANKSEVKPEKKHLKAKPETRPADEKKPTKNL